jgi:hypothetical protein
MYLLTNDNCLLLLLPTDRRFLRIRSLRIGPLRIGPLRIRPLGIRPLRIRWWLGIKI